MHGLLALSTLLALAAAAPSPRQNTGKGARVQRPEACGRSKLSSDVIIQLFQWNWDSIANECTNFIGPAGRRLGQTIPTINTTSADSAKQDTDIYK